MTGKEEFSTGAVRDSQEDKPRFDLITPTFLLRLATLLGEKAKHYGDRNWEQGINMSRSFASLERHVQAIKRGDYNEDHIAQAAANLMFLAEEQDGPNDDLHELWGPKINRDKNDNFDALMDDLKLAAANMGVPPNELHENWVYSRDAEPNRTQVYYDKFGRRWSWVVLDSGVGLGWMHDKGMVDGRFWETIQQAFKDSFPWTRS